jgi:hypothetical protein
VDRGSWLDVVTAGVRDSRRAREIRDELDSHLSAIVEELVGAGWSSADAEAEALHRMGDAVAVGKSLAIVTSEPDSHRQKAGIAGAFLFALSGVPLFLASLGAARFGSLFLGPEALGLLTVVSIAGLAAGAWLLVWSASLPSERGSSRGIWEWIRGHWIVIEIWTFLGIAFELAPFRFTVPALAGLSGWPWETAGWALLGVAVAVISLRGETVGASLSLLSSALWVWLLVGVTTGQMVLLLSPRPPASFAAIYSPASGSWTTLFSVWWKAQWVGVFATTGTFAVLTVRSIRSAITRIRYLTRKHPVTN